MPTIFLTADGDTFVYQFHPQRNYSKSSHMSAGRDTNGSLGCMLLSFDLRNTLPAGSVISNAALLLTVINSVQTTASAIYDLMRIQSSWSAGKVTWDSLPLCQTVPQASFASPPIGPFQVDLTSLAQDWQSGQFAEQGVIISVRGYPNCGTYFQAATINALNSDQWPKLSVEYSLPFVTVAPTFSNHRVNLVVPAGGSVEHTQDVSLSSLMTVSVRNNGPDVISAHLEISADGVKYNQSSSIKSIQPGGVVNLAADLFALYLRIVLTDEVSSGSSADVYFQGQIG